MSVEQYRELSWLPRPPEDFSSHCKGLATSDLDLGKRIRFLATHALNEQQLSRLGRTIISARKQGHSLQPLAPFRLGLIGNGTLDLIVPVLTATAARHGFSLECITGAYDQFLQDALHPDSALNRARPDAVLVALDHRGLALQPTPGDEQAAVQSVNAAIDLLGSIRSAISQNSGAVCILQTIAAPPEGLFGSFDRALTGTARNIVDQLNGRISQSVLQSSDLLLDVAGIAETVGLADWHSPAQWNLAKLPFSDTFVPLYAEHVCRIIGAMRGKSRRCLILDLDNTVWGGVIGDDGLEGIQIAQGDATGEAFLSVQQLALALRARGIVLAVSSKNNDEVARRPFREHPDMLLKEDHIAVFQANWDDKATNIRAIAKELALGLESMVFLDDNPVERGLVRREIPEVAVPELDSDPAGYSRTLAAGGYFEAISFSEEDRCRAGMYQANARRLSLQGQTSDLQSYLRSLEMRIIFGSFDRTTRSRVTQLINKSNQFNLTTNRYTETQVEQAELDPGVMTLHARLLDKFGDNGIICVVVCRPSRPQWWTIDTWLMSCRVLGRGVEKTVLAEILLLARAAGISNLEGVFIPTERNEMVREHYNKLGFTLISEETDGSTRWQLGVDVELGELPMTVERDYPHLELA
ncbi:HAD-IIIC family phosphatase [Bradyrhizobium iriomotense]|uniref:HAD-IIIC family phosphatase n=1 Tax=Bradyrhizobium iriomotense TaxID=441950 RepID=UPI0024E12349|nr:HAD-IIIC family phosphatase [Bradyrhizobium iriomotense]